MQSAVQSAALWAGWMLVSAEQPLARLAWARAFSWYKLSLRGQDEIPSSRETLSCPKPQCPYQNFLPLSGACFRTPWLWPWDQMGLDGTSDQHVFRKGLKLGSANVQGWRVQAFWGGTSWWWVLSVMKTWAECPIQISRSSVKKKCLALVSRECNDGVVAGAGQEELEQLLCMTELCCCWRLSCELLPALCIFPLVSSSVILLSFQKKGS